MITSWSRVTSSQVGMKSKGFNFRTTCPEVKRWPSWSPFSMDRLRPTSGHHGQKLIVSKLATFFVGLFVVNFRTTCPEVNCVQVGHHFPANTGSQKGSQVGNLFCGQLLVKLTRSYLWPWWSPFCARNFCPSWAEVETWTMMVIVFAYGTSAHEGRKLKCGPSWSTFFIPGTSDQVGPK